MKTLALMFCCLALTTVAAAAPKSVPLYVSPQGRDDWPGRADKPLATLAGARDRVRALRSQGALTGKPVTILVRGGVYPLAEPLTFTPADSGTAGAPVVYAAHPGETPVISGGRAITGWRAAPDGLWVATVPQDAGKPWQFRQLFVGAARRPRTVLPKTGFYTIADAAQPSQAGKAADGFHYGAGQFDPKWHNLDDVEVKCYHIWSMSRMRVASLDESGWLVRFTGTTCSTDYWAALPKGNRFQVENVFEALPAEPGAWYLNRRAGLVYYHPLPGERREFFAPVAPRLTRLVDFRGDGPPKRWVSDITLRGLSFQHADWTLAPSGYSCPQAEMEQPAAISASYARACRLENCEVAHVGSYAVELGPGTQGSAVSHCRLHDLGAGGVKIGGFDAGAADDVVARNNVVAHCRIFGGGEVHPAAIGVWIGQSPGNQILHNDIHDLYYTGVSVGWTWGYGPALARNTRVAYNRIYNIGRGLLSDMGGIYTLGDQRGSVLSHNIIHDVYSFDYGGWGIYPDEGTTGLVVRDNVVYGCKAAGFHQHYGKDNVIENNVFALNTEAQLARTRAEDHLSFTFAHNIVYWTRGDLLHGNWDGGQVAMDDNLYWRAGAPTDRNTPADWQKTGHDTRSRVADPLFVAPEAGDFTLRPGSPALAMGFHPIDLAGVGSGE